MRGSCNGNEGRRSLYGSTRWQLVGLQVCLCRLEEAPKYTDLVTEGMCKPLHEHN